MATAKKTAAKKAKTPDSPKALKADAKHPEVHPERHKGGLQELPTAGASAKATDEPGGGAGALQHKVAPNPGIGTTHDENDGSPAVTSVADDAEHVYSYEQALSLPIVEKGTPLRMPTDAQMKADKKKRDDKESAAAKRRNEERAAGTSPESEDVDLPLRKPIVAFKDADRRTMLVVKTKDGLGAMPAPAFADVAAVNA